MTTKNLFIIQSPMRVKRITEILTEIRPNIEWDVMAVLNPLAREKYKEKLEAVKQKIKSNNYERIIVATDPDAEGERVARDIYNFTGLDASKFNRIQMLEITTKYLDEIVDKEPQESGLPYMTLGQAYKHLVNESKENEQANCSFLGINYLKENTVKFVVLKVTTNKDGKVIYVADTYEGSLHEDVSKKDTYEATSIEQLVSILPEDVLAISYGSTGSKEFTVDNSNQTLATLKCYLPRVYDFKNKVRTELNTKEVIEQLNGMIYMLQKEAV